MISSNPELDFLISTDVCKAKDECKAAAKKLGKVYLGDAWWEKRDFYPETLGNCPIWQICFKCVETTSQKQMQHDTTGQSERYDLSTYSQQNLNGFGQVLRRREKKSVCLNAWFPILGWVFEFSTTTGGNVEISMFHNFVGFSTNGYFLGSCRNLRRHVKGVWSFAPQDCIKDNVWSVVEENWCTDTTFFFVDPVTVIRIAVL